MGTATFPAFCGVTDFGGFAGRIPVPSLPFLDSPAGKQLEKCSGNILKDVLWEFLFCGNSLSSHILCAAPGCCSGFFHLLYWEWDVAVVGGFGVRFGCLICGAGLSLSLQSGKSIQRAPKDGKNQGEIMKGREKLTQHWNFSDGKIPSGACPASLPA